MTFWIGVLVGATVMWIWARVVLVRGFRSEDHGSIKQSRERHQMMIRGGHR